MQKFGLIALISVSLLGSACGSKHDAGTEAQDLHETASSGGPESAACKAFIRSLPPGIIHGFVSVPESDSDASRGNIQVFYYARLVDGTTPVLVFNGGPTGNSHSTYSIMTRHQDADPSLKNLGLVFIDQRGTGCSTPYPTITTWSDVDRLQNWGSAGIVRDAEAVRRIIMGGDKPWKILGQSYGGQIVHRYVQLAGSSLISASSHGFALTNDPFKTIQARIESQKKLDDAYLSRYPDDQATFDTLNTQLSTDVCFTNTEKTTKRCGHGVMRRIYDDLGFLDTWGTIHKWLSEISRDGNGQITQKFLDQFALSPLFIHGEDAWIADSVIWKTDMNFGSTDQATCEKIYQNLQAKGESPQNWIMNECQPSADAASRSPSETSTYIDALPKQIILPGEFKTILERHPKLKFYLYSGEMDPYSPVAIFRDERVVLGQLIKYTDFATTGHEGFYTENLVWQNLMKD